MKKWLWLALLIVVFVWPVYGQVVHGINWSWPAITLDTAGNTIVVQGYNIYCSTVQEGPFTTKTNTSLITTTTYLQTGLIAGTTYYCQYTGVNAAGEGAHAQTSAGVTFQFLPGTGAAPAGVVQ